MIDGNVINFNEALLNKIMTFFVGCCIDQIGKVYPIQPNKQPYNYNFKFNCNCNLFIIILYLQLFNYDFLSSIKTSYYIRIRIKCLISYYLVHKNE